MFAYIDPTVYSMLLQQNKIVTIGEDGHPTNDGVRPGTERIHLLGPIPLPRTINGREYQLRWYPFVRRTQHEQVLDIALRENVREEAGGSYDIGVDAELNRYPDEEFFVYVGFGCAPDQVETLTDLVFEQIFELREQGPPRKDVDKVKEILRREHEQNLKSNDYWLGILQLAYINELDPEVLLDFDVRLQSISVDTLQSMAVKTLDPGNYVRVVLDPED